MTYCAEQCGEESTGKEANKTSKCDHCGEYSLFLPVN